MNFWGMPRTGRSKSTPSTATSSSLKTSSSSSLSGSTAGNLIKSENSSQPVSDCSSHLSTDSENNNQPGKLSPPQFLPPNSDEKSLASLSNSTVSAAADSSDNQPPTPQPSGASSVLGGSGGGTIEPTYRNSPLAYQPAGGHPILAQDMHHYPTYMPGYDQYYHPPPPPNMDYAAQSALYASQQVPPGNQEYKIVPSPRYHPYVNSNSSLHPQHSTNGTASNNASSSASNSSLSPRVVSSSSPTQNAIMSQGSQDSISSMQQQSDQGGSVGPKGSDKCGVVCPTHAQLSEHYSTVHGTQPPNDRQTDDQQTLQTSYSYQPYIKEEPPTDILDLDSQKMVYPPQQDPSTGIIGQDPLPPMHSMHPMHRSLMWGTSPDIHSGYMTHSQPPDMKPYYSPLKQNYAPVKAEYAGTVLPGYTGSQSIKSEFATHGHQTSVVQSRDIKPFNTDINSSGGNPVTTSPSEFPSTTTPQENGGQYRGFEPPTSSLPNNSTSGKSSTWKSNEARRPKTYNCTACNKWFTSSGHLKRHYNTTLHKNAVKSSGQPDPATLPISAHHHPSRDPNSKHHHSRNSQGNQPPPAPPEPPRSPDYTPQYTPPPNSYNQQQGFQQYTNVQQSNQSTNGHPNGQAGPSVRASLQQRGLLIISNTSTTSNLEAQQEQEQEMQVLQLQQQQVVDQDPFTSLQHQVHQQQEVMELGEVDRADLQQQAINTSSLELHQQQQQSQAAHIISMSPQAQQHMLQPQLPEDTSCPDTTPTTTTIINTMDQQYIITSPLAINTNITQSFHPLQPPAELSYHTITGNDLSHDQMLNTDAMGSPDQQQIYQLTSYGLNSQPQYQQIVAVRSMPSGMVSYQDTTSSLPYTPIVPESCLYSAQVKCERSPEVGDVAPEFSPYSPTISSTKAMVPSPTQQIEGSGGIMSTPSSSAAPAKRRKLDKKSQDNTATFSDANYTSLTLEISSTASPSNNSLGTPTGDIRCDECNKVFTKICYLTQHNKTFHNGEQPYRCNRCGKRFSNEAVFDTHYAKHSAAQKPHQCQFCPKQFHHKTDLRRHIDSHTGRKAYVCETCSKGFTRRDHLRKHGDTHKPKPPKPLKIRTAKAADTCNSMENSGGNQIEMVC